MSEEVAAAEQKSLSNLARFDSIPSSSALPKLERLNSSPAPFSPHNSGRFPSSPILQRLHSSPTLVSRDMLDSTTTPAAPPQPTTTAATSTSTFLHKLIGSPPDEQFLTDRAVRYFNVNISIGLRFHKQHFGTGLTEAQYTAKLAVFLRTTPGISKIHLGQVLAGSSPIREAFVKTFDLTAFSPTCAGVEQAFRFFLSFFKLPGEGQEIDRILESFANWFHECHKDSLSSFRDTTHQFLFLIIILNVNLNNPVAANSMGKMTGAEFCKCYSSIVCNHEQGLFISEQDLMQMYESIRSHPITFVPDREQVAGNLFTNPEMSGWLRAKIGNQWRYRNWYVLLSNRTLYFFEHDTSVHFRWFVVLENLKLFFFGDHAKTPQTSCSSLSSLGRRYREAQTRFSFKYFASDPLAKFKVGRLDAGMTIEWVSSLTIKTKTKEEFECWKQVLRYNLSKGPSYSIMSPHQQPSLRSWSSLTSSSPTLLTIGYEELKDAMETFPLKKIAEEEEEESTTTITTELAVQ